MEKAMTIYRPYNYCVLQSVHRMEKPVQAQRERIRESMTASLEPVMQYIDTYKEYEKILSLDPQIFIKEFEAAEHPLDAVRAHARMAGGHMAALRATVALGLPRRWATPCHTHIHATGCIHRYARSRTHACTRTHMATGARAAHSILERPCQDGEEGATQHVARHVHD